MLISLVNLLIEALFMLAIRETTNTDDYYFKKQQYLKR